MKEARISCFVKLVFTFYYILKVKGDALRNTSAELYFSHTTPNHNEVIHAPKGVVVTLPCPGMGKGPIEVTWLRDSVIIGHELISDPTSTSSYKRSKRDSKWSRNKRRTMPSGTEYSSLSNFSTANLTSTSQRCNKCISSSIAQTQQPTGCCILSNGSLQISNSNTSNKNGSYQCIISNKYGSLVSNRVQLLPLSNTSILSILPSISVVIGQSVRLSCQSGDVVDRPSLITWYKDENSLQNIRQPKHSFLPNGVLHLFDLLPQDLGSYWCRARNRYAEYHSIRLMLSANEPHAVEDSADFVYTSSRQLSCVEGETCIIECLPRVKATVNWRKFGVPVVSCDENKEECNVELLPSALVFYRVNSGNAGNYTCSFQNGQQSAEVNVTATIEPSKRYNTHAEVAVKKHRRLQTFELMCHPPYNTDAKLQWLFNGVPLPKTSLLTKVDEFPQKGGLFALRLERVYALDEFEGFYQCVAEGKDDYIIINTTQLVIPNKNDVPPPPTNITWKVGRTDVDLYWNVTVYNMAPYTIAYAEPGAVGQQLVAPPSMEGETSTFRIENLHAFTNYTVLIIPSPKEGATEYATVHFNTEEDVPCGTVNDPRVLGIIGRTALLSWKPLNKNQRCGIITSYFLTYFNSLNNKIKKDVPANMDSPDSPVYTLLTDLDYTLSEEDVYAFNVLASTKVGVAGFEYESLNIHFTIAKNPRNCKFNQDLVSWTYDQEMGMISVKWNVPNNYKVMLRLTAMVTGDNINHLPPTQQTEVSYPVQDNKGPFKLNVTFIGDDASCDHAEFILLKPSLERGPSIVNLQTPEYGCITAIWEKQNYTKYWIRVSHETSDVRYNTSVVNQHTFCGLRSATVYDVAIAGDNGNTTTMYGDYKTIATLTRRPSPVNNLQVIKASDKFSYIVTWAAPTGDGDFNAYIVRLQNVIGGNVVVKQSKPIDDDTTTYKLDCVDPRNGTTVEVFAFRGADEGVPVTATIEAAHDQHLVDQYKEMCLGEKPDDNLRLAKAMKIVIIVLSVALGLFICIVICVVARKNGYLHCACTKRDEIYTKDYRNGRYPMNGHSQSDPGVTDRLMNNKNGTDGHIPNGHSYNVTRSNGNGHIWNGNGLPNGGVAHKVNHKKSSKSNEPCWKKAKKHFPHALETTTSLASLKRHSSSSSGGRKGSKHRFFPQMKFRQAEADYTNTPTPHEDMQKRLEEKVVLSILTPSQSLMNQAANKDTVQQPPPSSDKHKTGDTSSHRLDEVIVTAEAEPLSSGEAEDLETSAVPLLLTT